MAGLGIHRNNLLSLRRDPSSLKAYLELHIEQGPILEARKKPIGVVTSIAAPTRFKVIITGQADHSGTTPMDMRKDALVAAAELTMAVEGICREHSDMDKGRVVGTVGALKIEPGVINAVPGKAELAVDVRSITAAAKNRVVRSIDAKIREIALRRKVRIEILPIRKEDPCLWIRRIVHLLQDCCEARDVSYEIMPSGPVMTQCRWQRLLRRECCLFQAAAVLAIIRWNGLTPEDISLGAQLLLDAIMRAANEKI